MSIKGLSEFTATIRGFQNQLPIDHANLCKKIANQVIDGVVPNTPVDTGEARGEWQVVTNSLATSPTNVLDKEGSQTVVKCKAAIAASDPRKQVIWISNRCDHIEVLEDGHSHNQAPAGMVEITLQQIKLQGIK